MDSLDEITKNGKGSFFKHVFNFNDDSKAEMMNIVQYAIIALVPVIALNKAMQRLVPEADDEKGSIEITAEIISQVVVLFLGILIIHRIITYVPTYSGEMYAEFSVTNMVLAFLVIILSLQTKLGEKVSIIVDRLVDLWEGTGGDKQSKGKGNGKGNVKVSQPISQTTMILPPQAGSTSISSLPPPQAQTQTQTQPQQDYNQMYQQDSTPLVGANDITEPMAANSGGGGGFPSAFGGW